MTRFIVVALVLLAAQTSSPECWQERVCTNFTDCRWEERCRFDGYRRYIQPAPITPTPNINDMLRPTLEGITRPPRQPCRQLRVCEPGAWGIQQCRNVRVCEQ